MMLGNLLKFSVAVTTVALAVPYTCALLCNLLYGWPLKNKFRRAFSPCKVFALNFCIVQSMIVKLRYFNLYLKWKTFYKMAAASHIKKDIPYGTNDKMLDLYFPQKYRMSGDEREYPIVVFIHGGAWGSGDKCMWALLCSAVANRLNVIVCCPNHSTYPQGFVDTMVQDIIDCMFWLYNNVECYRGDKNQMMLLGHSSGAHLCAMVLLELGHETTVTMTSSSDDLHLLTASPLQFMERHFDGRTVPKSDTENDVQHPGSTGSFYVVSGNGNNQNIEDMSYNLGTCMSESHLTQVSLLENEFQGLEQSADSGLMYVVSPESSPCRTVTTGRITQKAAKNADNVGDNNSGITFKQTDSDDPFSVANRHSSMLQLSNSVKAMFGIAGVYHIGDHFKHEYTRGVEDISTMTKAMDGMTNFDRYSPTHILSTLTTGLILPKIVLIHGTEDYVVPLSSTTKFAQELYRLNADVIVRIIPSCDHYEICLDLMNTNMHFHDTVMNLLEKTSKAVFS